MNAREAAKRYLTTMLNLIGETGQDCGARNAAE